MVHKAMAHCYERRWLPRVPHSVLLFGDISLFIICTCRGAMDRALSAFQMALQNNPESLGHAFDAIDTLIKVDFYT